MFKCKCCGRIKWNVTVFTFIHFAFDDLDIKKKILYKKAYYAMFGKICYAFKLKIWIGNSSPQ